MTQLKCDIKSGNGKMYGSAGDEVKIIDHRGTVFIVEDSTGVRFPVHESKITESDTHIEKTEIKDKEKIIIKPVQVAARPPKAKPAPINHPTLF